MDPNITAMLEQMRSQQQQQQQQHEAMMQRLVGQQAAQTPIGSREQKPGDPAARVEGRSELIPKFISCPQFNGKPEKISSSSSGEPFALSRQLLTRK